MKNQLPEKNFEQKGILKNDRNKSKKPSIKH